MKYILEREEFNGNIVKEFKITNSVIKKIIDSLGFKISSNQLLKIDTRMGDKFLATINNLKLKNDIRIETNYYKNQITINGAFVLYHPDKSVYLIRRNDKTKIMNNSKPYYIGSFSKLEYLDEFLFRENKYGFKGWDVHDAHINARITPRAVSYNKVLYRDFDSKYLSLVYATNALSKGFFIKLEKFYLRIFCLDSGSVMYQLAANIISDVDKNYDELDPILNNNSERSVGLVDLLGNVENTKSLFKIVGEILNRFGEDKKRTSIKKVNLDNIQDFIKEFKKEILVSASVNYSISLTDKIINHINGLLDTIKYPSHFDGVVIEKYKKNLGEVNIIKNLDDKKFDNDKYKTSTFLAGKLHVDIHNNAIVTIGYKDENEFFLGPYKTLPYLGEFLNYHADTNLPIVQLNSRDKFTKFMKSNYIDKLIDYIPANSLQDGVYKYLNITGLYTLRLACYDKGCIWFNIIDYLDSEGNAIYEKPNSSQHYAPSLKNRVSYYLGTIDDLDYIKKFLDKTLKHFKK